MAGMWDQYKTLTVEQQDIEDAIRDTEAEIAASPWDEVPDDNDFSDDMEQVESFDGEQLSIEDMLEGPNDNGYDRPASLRRDENLLAENEELRRRVAEQDAHLNQVTNGPQQLEAAFQQWKEHKYEAGGALYTDENKARQQFYAEVQQSNAVQNLQNNRFNESMGRAHREYGPDFERTFESFRSMDQRNPTARALAQEVWNAPDPGQRMMALNGSAITGMHSGRGLHPDLGLAGARTAPVRGGRDLAQEPDFFGNDEVEADIFRSAWD